jgi:molecular chaperone GrpE
MSKKTRHDDADLEGQDPTSGKDGPSSGGPSGSDGQSSFGSSRAGDRDAESSSEASRTGDESDLAKLRRERDENLQNWKRATADYQNLRRRLQSDIDAASQRAKQPMLLDLLLVLDYLEMALKTPVTTVEGKNLAAGVELTRSVLLRTLERENVRAVAEDGPFDAAVHQAVESVQTRDHAPGTILGTLRRGYTSNGQVIRPAQVRVAVEPTGDVRAESASNDDSGTES